MSTDPTAFGIGFTLPFERTGTVLIDFSKRIFPMPVIQRFRRYAPTTLRPLPYAVLTPQAEVDFVLARYDCGAIPHAVHRFVDNALRQLPPGPAGTMSNDQGLEGDLNRS